MSSLSVYYYHLVVARTRDRMDFIVVNLEVRLVSLILMFVEKYWSIVDVAGL